MTKTNAMKKVETFEDFDPEAVINDRGITADTFKKYGCSTNDSHHYYPYYDKDNNLVAVMQRETATKLFTTQPSGSGLSALLWGAHLFPKGSANTIIITEGQLDAMSAYQMLSGRIPCVSLPNGANSLKKVIESNYEYLSSFNNVILALDNDDEGRKATAELARMLPGGKVKVADFPSEAKDANDMLFKMGEPALFNRIINGAKIWIPQGVHLFDDLIEDFLNRRKKEPMIPYPYEGFNKLLLGVYGPSLIVFTGGTGGGKSQAMRELVHHLYKTTEHKIGLMFLEESKEDTVGALLSLEMGKIVGHPDVELTDEEIRLAHTTLSSQRLLMFSEFGSSDIDEIVDKVSYMAKVADCKFVFLDHISILVSSQENGDERKAIDAVMTRLRTLVQQTGITLFAVTHLRRGSGEAHEDGGQIHINELRGSQSIAQLSDAVVAFERNQQHEDDTIRNTTLVRVLKARRHGTRTGPACALVYDHKTTRSREMPLEDYYALLQAYKESDEDPDEVTMTRGRPKGLSKLQ